MMLSHTTSAPFLQYSSTGIITGILKLLKAKGIPVNTRCIIARAASEEASSREVQQDGKLQPAKTQSSPPKLVNVPALPFVGSLVTMHSGFTQWNLDQPYLHFLSNREKFGDFYSLVSEEIATFMAYVALCHIQSHFQGKFDFCFVLTINYP